MKIKIIVERSPKKEQEETPKVPLKEKARQKTLGLLNKATDILEKKEETEEEN